MTPIQTQARNLRTFAMMLRAVAKAGPRRGLSSRQMCRALRMLLRRVSEPTELPGDLYGHILAMEAAPIAAAELAAFWQEEADALECDADALDGRAAHEA